MDLEKPSKRETRKSSGGGSTKCKLVEAVWTFWPAFQRWADTQTGELPLTPQRTRILASLQERGAQIMSDLKDELGVTATNITALVDALEKDGLVVRKAHPKDRRATLIDITPKAECELMKSCSGYRERVGDLFSILSESDRKDLLRMLEALKAHLSSSAQRE